jgi:hypothetical protein
MAAFTSTQYQTLCATIATGVLKVRYDNGHEVTYQNAAEMLDVKRQMEAVLGLDSTGNPLAAGQTFDRTVGVYDPGY